MTFALYGQEENFDAPDYYRFDSSCLKVDFPDQSNKLKLITDKFLAPTLIKEMARPRLVEQLKKSLAQFSATIITGRAGTGKSVLAAQFAAQTDLETAWYKVETSDGDWKVFASYLLGSLNRLHAVGEMKFDEREVAAQSAQLAEKFVECADKRPILLILDDLHAVFDADWFADFFNNFVPPLPPNVQILLIARTLPPLAVWRLRSKQVLGVVEEKLLAFSSEETVKLFEDHRLCAKTARAAFQSSYGKISKILEIIAKKTAALNQSI